MVHRPLLALFTLCLLTAGCNAPGTFDGVDAESAVTVTPARETSVAGVPGVNETHVHNDSVLFAAHNEVLVEQGVTVTYRMARRDENGTAERRRETTIRYDAERTTRLGTSRTTADGRTITRVEFWQDETASYFRTVERGETYYRWDAPENLTTDLNNRILVEAGGNLGGNGSGVAAETQYVGLRDGFETYRVTTKLGWTDGSLTMVVDERGFVREMRSVSRHDDVSYTYVARFTLDTDDPQEPSWLGEARNATSD